MGNIPAGEPTQENLIVKRFTISKAGIAKDLICDYTDSKGVRWIYSQQAIWSELSERFESMECWSKYRCYTNSKTIPAFIREAGLAHKIEL